MGSELDHPTPERLYAAQAAADLLGIHRTTLYLAVRKMKLIPDAYTPGGHARFRRETLERFKDRLTLDSATGGDGGIARAVAQAVGSLSRSPTLQPVCEAVVEAALLACPGFETCLALAHDDHCPTGYDLRLVAERGLPQRLALEYRFRRRQRGHDFITARVVRQRSAYFCSDVLSAPDAPKSGLLALTDTGYRSCAALPCVWENLTLGVLICLGRAPCDLSEPETVALTNLADVLTIALRRERREEAVRRQSATIGELMRLAQTPAPGAANADPLADVRRICRQGAQARLVGEWGLTETNVPPPLVNLLRAAAANDALQRAEWAEQDGARVALAIPVRPQMQTTGQAQRAAVGAIWRRHDLCTGLESTLLQVYAQTCSNLARPPLIA